MRLLGFVFALSLIFSCGDELTPVSGSSSSQCPTGWAQIGIYDGVLQVQCGCQETAGAFIDPPQALTCTINAGTIVAFQFINNRLKHQIVPTNAGDFPASAVADPEEGTNRIFSHAVTFSSTGTFPFQDQYNTSLNGQIIVQ